MTLPLSPVQAPADFRCGTVAIVGRPNVGKSTLLNQLVGERISITSRKAQTTRHRIRGIRTDPDAQYVFIDTPGYQTAHSNALNRVMNRSVTSTLAEVDAIAWIVDATRVDERDQRVLALIPAESPVVVVLNKIDRVGDKGALLPLLDRIGRMRAFAALVPISAKQGTGVPELLQELKALLPEQPPMYAEDEITDRSERFLAAEFIREQLFRLLGEELPYATSVVIDQFKTEGNLRRIYATILVDKANQKSIVIGRGGEKMKEMASLARAQMERLFGGPVYLEMWVKVKSGWADDERMVRSLGYGDL
jgi:GTPase